MVLCKLIEQGNTLMVCPVHFCLLNACLVNDKTLIVKLRFVAEHCNDLVWSQKHGCNQKLMMIDGDGVG